MTPGTITRTPDGAYEVHGLTDSTVVANEQLAELVAARVRKAFGGSEPNRERKAGVGRRPRITKAVPEQ